MSAEAEQDFDDLCRSAFESWRENDGNKTHAAQALGWSRSVFRHRLNRYFERHLPDWAGIDVPPGYRIDSRSVKLDANGRLKHQFVRIGKAPSDEPYEMPEGHILKGESVYVNSEGRVRSKWIKTREGERSIEQLAEAMEKAATEYVGMAAPIILHPEATARHDPDLLNIHLLPDLHMGMSTTLKTTGEAWDLKIADKTYRRLFRLLTERAAFAMKAVLLFGGDTTHYDDPTKMSRRSGNLFSGPRDYTYTEVLSTTQKLAVYHVELALQKYGFVEVRVLPGNHDPDSAIAISHFLAAWFRHEPRVVIDTDESLFWFYEHGVCMFGATHGHEAKVYQLPGIMAADEPEMWGRTKLRDAFGFHVHGKEKGAGREAGARWETFETAIPLDRFHHDAGYRSTRSLCVRTYHVARGMTGEVTEMIV